MPTIQYAIAATSTNSVPVPAQPGIASIGAPFGVGQRHFLYIHNYSTSGSISMWIAFNQVATPGNNGELEIIPGSAGDLVFGGNYSESTNVDFRQGGGYFSPNCPTGAINVITSGSTAKGCVLVITYLGA